MGRPRRWSATFRRYNRSSDTAVTETIEGTIAWVRDKLIEAGISPQAPVFAFGRGYKIGDGSTLVEPIRKTKKR